MSILDCKNCDGKLSLVYKDDEKCSCTGEKIKLMNVPMLVCGKCGASCTPQSMSDWLQKILERVDQQSNDQNTLSHEDESNECSRCFDFNDISRDYCSRAPIEDLPFLYDGGDYCFIPGLYRGSDRDYGFLTPVFFKIEVLTKYINRPDYGLDMTADTMGNVYHENEHYFSFGINENNRVVMWLGDIKNLPLNEQYYLRSENIPSDHSIGSAFYEAQIEADWVEVSSERKLLNSRLKFNENVRRYYGFSIAQLNIECLQLTKDIRKLFINTNVAFETLIITLNKLLVESINSDSIRSHLLNKYPELKEQLKNVKSIKLLQAWLEKYTDGLIIESEIAPLFVLYDLRVKCSHLTSIQTREEELSSCCKRLGLPENERDNIIIADALVESLTTMYDRFYEALKKLD